MQSQKKRKLEMLTKAQFGVRETIKKKVRAREFAAEEEEFEEEEEEEEEKQKVIEEETEERSAVGYE